MDKEVTVFKVLADSTRLRLLTLLAISGEVCVCQLAEALDEPEYKVSRHLGILRTAGLVETRRQGTWIYYQLCKPDNNLVACLQDCLKVCFKDHDTVRDDLRRLQHSACGTNVGKE